MLVDRSLQSRMPFAGNFLCRALGNILFPVPTQYRHSGLASSHLVSARETFRNSQMLPKLQLIILISVLVKTFPSVINLYWAVQNMFISQIFPGFSRATGPERSSLVLVLTIWELSSRLAWSHLV